MSNPWVPAEPAPPPTPEDEAAAPAPRWAPGAEVVVEDGLPVRAVEADGVGLWLVGAHGGAGTSSLACVLGAGDAGGCWPLPAPGEHRQVLVVARTHARGIAAAQAAAIQWAAGGLVGVDLAGVIWVPDAPGRIPRPLRAPLALAEGAFPMSVYVPWVGAWRTSTAQAEAAPRDVLRALAGVQRLVKGEQK